MYPTLPAMDGGGANNQAVIYPVGAFCAGAAPAMPLRRYIVRRLTPTECARLQGFPDWWTDDIPGSDSAQYKMWGNGQALPCELAVFIGIDAIDR